MTSIFSAPAVFAAAQGWGRSWAPGRAGGAARVWRDELDAGRRITELTSHYMDPRYEELVGSQGTDLLGEAFAHCGLQTASEQSSTIHAAFAFDQGGAARSSPVWGGEVRRRLQMSPAEPKGFSGEGGVGAWQYELTIWDRVAIDDVACELLRKLRLHMVDWLDRRPASTAARAARAQEALRAAVWWHASD